MDEALSRGHQHIVDLINSISAPSKEVDEVSRQGNNINTGKGAMSRGALGWQRRGCRGRPWVLEFG